MNPEDMTDKELVAELNSSEQGLELGVSKRDLIYNADLWREVDRRGLEIKRTLSI